MAEVDNTFVFERPKGSYKYYWSEWLDGQTWKLTKGKDFSCSTRSMRTAAQDAGKKLGFKVATGIRGDVIYVKAFDEDGSALATKKTEAIEGLEIL